MSILPHVLKRMSYSVLAVFILITLVFIFIKLIPGDPARFRAGVGATREQVEKARRELGLDKPVLDQYLQYLTGLVRGDLGESVISNRAVLQDVKEHLAASLELTAAALLIGIVIGFPLATLAATKANSPVDHFARLVGLTGIAIPTFWFGLVLILVFYRYLHLLPSGGRFGLGAAPSFVTGFVVLDSILGGDWHVAYMGLKHLILPAICLSPGFIAPIVRIFRASLLEIINNDYIKTARAKGLRERVVIGKHAYKNALIPTVTLLGNAFGILVGNAILTEVVFYWPGIGSYALNALTALDYTAAMGATLTIGLVVFVVNFGIDMLILWLDPKIRTE